MPPADASREVAEDGSLNKQANALPPRRAPGTPPRGADEDPQPILHAIDPLPNPGSEISGPAQERFSKNWERMDAGAVPMSAPPQPVRLNSRDRVVTRLQDLPGAGWLLHGGRFAGGPWLLMLFALIVAAAAFFVVKDAADYTSPEADPVSGETWRYFEPLTSEEILAAEEVITKFFASDSVEELEALIRAPETVMPLVYRYYDEHPLEQAEVASFPEKPRRANLIGLDITLHRVMLEGQLKERSVPTEHTPEGPKVDWEMAMNYQPMGWQEYLRKRPSETTYFRLSLQPAEFYDEPFDPSIFRSFRLDYPGDLRVMYGYAMIDSNLELRLREIMPNNESVRELIVGIEFLTGEHFQDNDLVEITELRSESWIVAYEPNERHFDLPPAGLPETSSAVADPLTDDALPASEEEQTEDVPEPATVPAVPVEETELSDEPQE